jgi:nicotinamidase-related amidase
MISQFGRETALLVIDAQRGIDALQHWGGPTGRRNNSDAEAKIACLLAAFRGAGIPVMFTLHDSREALSPLKLGTPGGLPIEGLEPQPGELAVRKDVNGGFTGTALEIELRRRCITRIVACGFFTNFCVETTVRQAGNMGYDTYLVEDACATSNRIGLDGRDFDPELVHAVTVATLHGEFCTAVTADQAIGLVGADAPGLMRVQGNELEPRRALVAAVRLAA